MSNPTSIPKRFRKAPWREGSITEIYRIFFRPIIKNHCPDSLTPHEFLEEMFDVDHRDIVRYRAKRNFKMPGLFYVSGNQKVQGIGFRQVKQHAILWLRTDSKNPDFVDIEFMGGVGEMDQVFSLTSSEFNSIAPFIKKIDKD